MIRRIVALSSLFIAACRARGVPARHLLPALARLVTELHDFPRARRILGAARDELTRTLDPGPAA